VISDRDYLHHVNYFYNRFARFYDLGEFVRRGTRQAVVAISGYKPGDRVLDVCTGTGEQALTFTKNGALVVGIDIARGVLLNAKLKSAETKPEWLEMDASNLCFRDKSFDITTLSCSSSYVGILPVTCVAGAGPCHSANDCDR
jgi:ubiquinone/menaquinone biosynthesis C-methylase UbiE